MPADADVKKRRAAYDAYLLSPEWKGKRQAAVERADGRCQVCNAARRLDVHHRTYERFGHEDPGDLTVLCRRCHDLFHDTGRHVTPGNTKRRGRECEVCGEFRSGMRRAVCGPCRKAQRNAPKPKPEPRAWTKTDAQALAIHLREEGTAERIRRNKRRKKLPPVEPQRLRELPAEERKALNREISKRNRRDAKKRRARAPKPSPRDVERYGGYLAKQAAKSRSADQAP